MQLELDQSRGLVKRLSAQLEVLIFSAAYNYAFLAHLSLFSFRLPKQQQCKFVRNLTLTNKLYSLK